MENITFEVILRALIGVSSPDRFERLSRLLRTLLQFNLVDMWAVWLFPRILETPLGRRQAQAPRRRHRVPGHGSTP